MAVITHPWQYTPTELIECALGYMDKPSDLDQRLAFLLLDVGVETLFKTYLTLPDEVIKASLPYPKRREAAGGGFHSLAHGVKAAAGEKITNNDISHVEYFHTIRNRLYHEGDGVTVSARKVNEYAALATRLLKALLDVDLAEEDTAPIQETPAPPQIVGPPAPDEEARAIAAEVYEVSRRIRLLRTLVEARAKRVFPFVGNGIDLNDFNVTMTKWLDDDNENYLCIDNWDDLAIEYLAEHFHGKLSGEVFEEVIRCLTSAFWGDTNMEMALCLPVAQLALTTRDARARALYPMHEWFTVYTDAGDFPQGARITRFVMDWQGWRRSVITPSDRVVLDVGNRLSTHLRDMVAVMEQYLTSKGIAL